jgi:hypothetical protein
MVKSGQIPSVLIGKRRLIDPRDLEDLIQNSKTRGKPMTTGFLKFPGFAGKLWPVLDKEFVGGDHLSEAAEALHKVALGETKRLIIMMPPRYGKTTLVSKLFPAYFAGLNPDAAIAQVNDRKVYAKLNASLAEKIMGMPDYKEVFPDTTPNLALSFGVGDSTAGYKLDLAVCDDLQGIQEYHIGLTRPKIYNVTYDWFKRTICQRVAPDGAIVIVASRLSKRDLIGRLLEEEGDKWTVVKVPALNADNQSTWPAYWSTEELRHIHYSLGTDLFKAEYMQEPLV